MTDRHATRQTDMYQQMCFMKNPNALVIVIWANQLVWKVW